MSLAKESLQDRLHLATALLCAWLILTSPWVAMLRRIPTEASWLDYAHATLGSLTVLVGIAYTIACTRGGRWRTYFPWLGGDVKSLARDVRGLFDRKMPSAESGGLFATIEGLLLVALLAVGLTGIAWWAMQGASDALAWRGAHVVCARVLVGLIVAHVLAVATHLIELA
jgi:cytochrome b561